LGVGTTDEIVFVERIFSKRPPSLERMCLQTSETLSHFSSFIIRSFQYSQCASATLCNGMVLHSLRLFPSAPSLHQNIRLLLFGWSQLFVACEFGTPSLIRRGTLDVRLRRDNVVFEKSTRYDAVFGSFQSC
jgi:hypothetical protein